jgi:hypothetical protein
MVHSFVVLVVVLRRRRSSRFGMEAVCYEIKEARMEKRANGGRSPVRPEKRTKDDDEHEHEHEHEDDEGADRYGEKPLPTGQQSHLQISPLQGQFERANFPG